MRQQYKRILKELFHKNLLRRRVELGFSQEEMAYRLFMANRTYVDLDHGKTCCSAITLALYLIYICADPIVFLQELREALEEYDQKVA